VIYKLQYNVFNSIISDGKNDDRFISHYDELILYSIHLELVYHGRSPRAVNQATEDICGVLQSKAIGAPDDQGDLG